MRQSHARLLSTIAILLVVLTGALSAVRGAMAGQPSTRHTAASVSGLPESVGLGGRDAMAGLGALVSGRRHPGA
jgi:hypothetical protein